MPHKFNSDRRDKLPKQKQRVTNWAEYGFVAGTSTRLISGGVCSLGDAVDATQIQR